MYFLNKKLTNLLNKEDINKLPYYITVVLISSFVEILGLGVLIPIANFILNPNLLIENNFSKLLSFLRIDSNPNLFATLIILFFIFYLIKILLLLYTNLYQAIFSFNFNKKLSNYFYKNYLNKEYFTFNDLSSSIFIRNSILEIDKLTEYLINNLRLITEVVAFTIIVFFLFIYNFFPTLIILGLILIFSFVYYLFLRVKIFRVGLTKQKYENKKIQFLNSAFGGIKDIKMSFSENFFYKKFNNFNNILATAHGKNAIYNILPRFLLELILVGLFCVYLILGKLTQVDFISITATLPIYFLAFIRLFPSANKILISFQSMRLNKPSLNIIYNKIKEYNVPVNKNSNELFEEISFKKSIKINIKNFRYTSRSPFELKNINIEIKKGEKIGIMGTTGSGKSTIIELLTNIIYLQNGEILVDNKSTKNHVRSWRSIIGYIPQKIYILEDSLKNNICLNEKYKKFNQKYFVNIIKKVGLFNWYKKLPNGLSSNLNERGLSLSGGEIQRLGIARALVNNPEILILDEATSALDTFTEKKILKNIFKLKNKTLICISHRMETLKNFDRIYIINNGKLILSKKNI